MIKEKKETSEENHFLPEHKLLLEAALLKGKKSENAFVHWQAVIDFEALDYFSYQLLPKLYLNLGTQAGKNELMPRIKGIYRKTWLANQLLKRELSKLFSYFKELGLSGIVSGAALGLWEIYDEGIYTTNEFSVLMSTADFSRAAEIFEKENQFSVGTDFRAEPAGNKSLILCGKGDIKIHLQPSSQMAFKRIWDAGRSWQAASDNSPIKMLSFEDQLLELCKKDFLPLRTKTGLWAMGTSALTGSETPLRWQKVIEEAARQEIGTALAEMLSISAHDFAAQIPEAVIEKLSRQPKPRVFSRVKWMQAQAGYASLRETYQRNSGADKTRSTPFGFMRFLTKHWQLTSFLSLPIEIGRRYFLRSSK